MQKLTMPAVSAPAQPQEPGSDSDSDPFPDDEDFAKFAEMDLNNCKGTDNGFQITPELRESWKASQTRHEQTGNWRQKEASEGRNY